MPYIGRSPETASKIEDAVSGIIEANAAFVDMALFGPAMDKIDWDGRTAASTASLMLATVETAGQVNIWDVTGASLTGLTPVGTVTISGVSAATSIAASMGYLIVGSEDGIAIIDPHSGAWAERTVGWPRTLSTSTTPALTNNDVQDVAAGFSDTPTYDPLTGGDMPCFVLQYGTGADIAALLKDDGSLYNKAGTVGNKGVGIWKGMVISSDNASGDIIRNSPPISTITADDWSGLERISATNDRPAGFIPDNGISIASDIMAVASDSGLTLTHGLVGTVSGTGNEPTIVKITRSINSGIQPPDTRGCWLGNSKTVDHGSLSNALTENGTVTEAAVESGAELLGYSGWSSSNNLTRASDADWDVITTGAAYLTGWFKSTGNSGVEDLFGFGKSDDSITLYVRLQSSGVITGIDRGATAADRTVASTQTYDDSVWHKIDFVRNSSTDRALYIDGVLIAENTDDAGSLSSSGNLPFAIGVNYDGSSVPAASSTITLVHLSTTAPSAAQIRQWYELEKPMFAASAECLLQSGTTDAVIDVDVDPLSGKVIVTQTDAITIFDGLVVDSKPTVNSGASEKGKLWGSGRVEINSANCYATMPSVDQRQVNEMVRGLASNLPKGVDLSKAKAWAVLDGTGTINLTASYNIKSITDHNAGDYTFSLAVPLKNGLNNGVTPGAAVFVNGENPEQYVLSVTDTDIRVRNATSAGSLLDTNVLSMIVFGELENE